MSEVIEQNKIPRRALYTGETIPAVGLGTFGSDKYGPEQVSEAVYGSIKAGYRLIDCAAVYQNEDQIGKVLKRVLDEGIVERKELLSPPRYGMICMAKDRCWNPAGKAFRI